MSDELTKQWRLGLAQDIVSGKEKYELNDAARLLEDEIERRGLQEQYIQALGTIVDPNPYLINETWALIRATPEQRAKAFLEATRTE